MIRKAEINDLRILAELACRLWPEHTPEELSDEFAQIMELSDAAFEGLTYLESTDCYYFFATGVYGANEEFEAKQVEHLEDGTVKVTYAWWDGVSVVTLKPNGDGYLILSNVQIS